MLRLVIKPLEWPTSAPKPEKVTGGVAWPGDVHLFLKAPPSLFAVHVHFSPKTKRLLLPGSRRSEPKLHPATSHYAFIANWIYIGTKSDAVRSASIASSLDEETGWQNGGWWPAVF
jgi:hypothetical protein